MKHWKLSLLKQLLLIYLLMLQSFASASSLDPELEKLINSIIGKKELSLATEGCHIQKEKWALILLTKQVFVEDIKFKDKCDIEGKFTVKADQFFPISLKLRKLNHYHLFNAKIKFEVTFTDQAVLKLELIQASLTGKKSIYFKLDYAVIIDPLNPESMIKKHLGGNLVITSKDYKKEIKSYKLKSDKLK